MQTVEQNVNPIADDGRMVPEESGKTGEIGSAAGSREDVRREWEELIGSPKFHETYTEHISEIVRKRLKTERESRTILDGAVSLLGLDDPTQLSARIQEMLAPAQRDWQSEEGAVREKYPEFDLQREQNDPAFAELLQGFVASPQVSLTKLYELFHLDSLKASAALDAADRTASQLLGAMQVRHARPNENGLHDIGQAAGRTTRLTRTQRAMLAERAAKGERITF